MERGSIKWTHTCACMFVRYDKKSFIWGRVCVSIRAFYRHEGSVRACVLLRET